MRKLSRRELLVGASVTMLPLDKADAFFPRGVPAALSTHFIQGALGGGGFQIDIALSNDGQGVISHSDTYQTVVLNQSTQLWENIFTSDRFGSAIQIPFGGGTHAVAVAPSNKNRMYVCSIGLNNPYGKPNTVTGQPGRYLSYNTVFRSDDGGQTFTATAMTTLQGCTGVNRLNTPHMAVDPNNQDIVYIANQTGIFFVTYNGGTSWSRVDGLLPALSTCTAASSAASGSQTVALNSNTLSALYPTTHAANINMYAYDITNPSAIGQDGDRDSVAGGTSATVLNLAGALQNPGVSAGDTIYLGCIGFVVIDGNSGTVANPGGSGVASKQLYFGWGWGASKMWQSSDGGVTFSAFASGPFQISHPQITNDATGGVLYCCDNSADLGFGSSGSNPNTNCWRWVPAVAPVGSGLTPNTWTNITAFSILSSWGTVATDPSTAGHVVSANTNLADSTDYGASNPGTTQSGTGLTGSSPADVPWLVNTYQPFNSASMGSVVFDPSVSNKLWLANGIGVWHTQVAHNNTTPVWTSRTRGIDTMTVQSVVKAPAPNGRILVAVQDRCFFSCIDENTFPTKDHPFNDGGDSGVQQPGFCIYSDSSPAVVWGSQGNNIWRSTDSGDNWICIGGPHSTVGTGFVAGSGRACLASTGPLSCVAAGNPQGSPAVNSVMYATTADSGATWTWQNSLYNGARMPSSATFDYGTNGKFLISDGAGNYYYYDFGNDIVAGGGLWKSVDGGATFTYVSVAKTPDNNQLSAFSGHICPVLAACPGFPNILVYAPGGGFSPKAFAATPLKISFDAGVTWANVNSTFQVTQVAFGKAKPGNTYPTIFIGGQIADFPSPWGLFRCDDFNGVNTTMTWNRLDNVRKVSCEAWRSISGDLEVYGKVYLGTTSSGYIVGTLG